MNLSKVEKIIIMVLVVGGILALGFFLLFKPAYESIGKAENNLTRAQSDYDDLMAKLERLNTIDEDIKTSKEAITGLEEKFYPDLTTYEAVEIILAQLKKYELDTYAISANALTTEELKLEYYEEAPVIYALKTYAQNAKEAKEGEVVLAEGQFLDGDKVYTITVTSLSNISIADDAGTVIEPAKYTETMVKAYKEALCRYAANGKLVQEVSALVLSFDVSGEYKNYLDFIDYIYDFDRATYLRNVEIPMSLIISADEDGKYFDTDGKEIKVEEGFEGEITMEYKDTDIVEGVPVTVVFYGVEQVEEIESLDIEGVKVVTNQ
ncbi:MAG: hypothetical protein IJY73_04200 [Oscillospiraceae bacterium]|nr:hypothetical protein [Oscillospiraceae bacterium]